MSKLASEQSSVQVSVQQTRFALVEDDASREVDIKGLNIAVTGVSVAEPSAGNSRKKQTGKPAGLELLSGAHLRVKSGCRCGLVGRNGTGKSTLLRAISEKLIPGLPPKLRVAALQQTSTPGAGQHNGSSNTTVLQTILDADAHRIEVQTELTRLNDALDSTDVHAPVRVIRELQLQAARRKLFEMEKMAHLRSGARGFDVRQALRKYEDEVAALEARAAEALDEITPEAVETDMQDASKVQGDLQAEIDDMSVEKLEARAKAVCFGLGFRESQLGQKYESLSGGWKMRCMLAAALVQPADLLILDEPTNYLDLLGILWLQHHLEGLRLSSPDTAVVLVSHDRDFINAVCDELIILKEKTLTYFEGNLDAYDKSIRHETLRLSRMQDAQDKQRAHMEKTIAENIKQGKKHGDDNKLRQATSRQKKLDDRMGMQVSAKGGRFKLNRDLVGYHLTSRDAIDIPKAERETDVQFPPAPDLRFPGSLISIERASLHYKGAPKPTLEELDVVIHPGDRVGIIGLNGAGKSTLIHALVGRMKATTGKVTHHPRLKVGVYSQHAIDALAKIAANDEAATALSTVLKKSRDAEVDMDEGDARKLLGRLGIQGRTASDTPLGKLSGGQLVRVALAGLFVDPPHVFVLDEPTTHLDLPTVTGLAKGLKAYDGALVLVTHDRFLIRTVIEGEAVKTDDGDEEDDGSSEDEDQVERRRLIYEVRGGRAVQTESGMTGWESRLEQKLQKLAI